MGAEGLISRVADSCFWFGRYVDRAESTARLLQVTRALAFDADLSALECWQPVVIVSGQFETFVERFGSEAAGDGEIVQRYMTWDTDNPASLRTSVHAGRDVSRSIRDVLALEVWEVVNEIYLWVDGQAAEGDYAQNREEFYRHVRRSTQLALGLVRSTMLHETPMDFLWLGVLLERIGQTARILDMHHHTLTMGPAETPHRIVESALWLSLLRACSGFEPFMKHNQGRVTRTGIISFLVYEQRFPRSLRYCVRSALQLLKRIWPPDNRSLVGERPRARLEDLDRWLDAQEAGGEHLSIHELLTHVVDETAAVCAAIAQDITGDSASAAAPVAVAAQ